MLIEKMENCKVERGYITAIDGSKPCSVTITEKMPHNLLAAVCDVYDLPGIGGWGMQNASIWGIPAPYPNTPAAEKIRCPDCFSQVNLPGDAFKEKYKHELDCGCRFTKERLAKKLGRTLSHLPG